MVDTREVLGSYRQVLDTARSPINPKLCFLPYMGSHEVESARLAALSGKCCAGWQV